MSEADQQEEIQPMDAEEILSAFLSLVMKHPEKPPKQQYRQRENSATILGFNRAQETLRDIIKNHGATEELRQIAEVREEGQQQPIEGPGGGRMWVMG